MPGMLRSSTYIDEPVIRRGSSLRRTSAPTSRLKTMGTLLLRRPVPVMAQALTLGQTTEHSTVHDAILGPARSLGDDLLTPSASRRALPVVWQSLRRNSTSAISGLGGAPQELSSAPALE